MKRSDSNNGSYNDRLAENQEAVLNLVDKGRKELNSTLSVALPICIVPFNYYKFLKSNKFTYGENF